jgi:membrane peptidoglycan carboxypeptidase
MQKQTLEKIIKRAATITVLGATSLSMATCAGAGLGSVLLLTELQTGFAEKATALCSGLTAEDIEPKIDFLYSGILPHNYNLIVHDKDGNVIAESYNLTNRTALEDIPEHVRWAFVAAEDRRFYDHHGWNPAILLGVGDAVLSGGLTGVRGYSTISVQVADIMYPDKEYASKLQLKIDEWAAAAVMEQYKTKDEILLEYMNITNFGYSPREGIDIIGIDAAAEYYFGKEPKELDYLEAAILAGMVQNPAKLGVLAYDALMYGNNPESSYVLDLKKRTEYVLGWMDDLNYGREEQVIPEREYEKALQQLVAGEIPFKHNNLRRIDPAVYGFASEVLERVPFILHEIDSAIPTGSDVHIYTGLDIELQQMLQQRIDDQCKVLQATTVDKDSNTKKFAENNSFNGAAVVLDTKTNLVRAMVDGCSVYATSEKQSAVGVETKPVRIANVVNRATRPFWHPGSSVKGIIDLIAVEMGYKPTDTFKDESRTFQTESGAYRVSNFGGGKGSGAMYTLLRATVRSVNTIFTNLLYDIVQQQGEQKVVEMFNDFGFDIKEYRIPYGIGAFEAPLTDIAGAYAVIAHNGVGVHYAYGDNDDVNVSYIDHLMIGDFTLTLQGVERKVVSAETAQTVDAMLIDVVNTKEGTGTKAQVAGMKVRGKTGTAVANVAFVGYEPTLHTLAVVEYGLENPGVHLPSSYQGGRYAAPTAKFVFEYVREQSQKPL